MRTSCSLKSLRKTQVDRKPSAEGRRGKKRGLRVQRGTAREVCVAGAHAQLAAHGAPGRSRARPVRRAGVPGCPAPGQGQGETRNGGHARRLRGRRLGEASTRQARRAVAGPRAVYE